MDALPVTANSVKELKEFKELTATGKITCWTSIV